MQIDEIKDILIKLYQKSLYVRNVDVEKHPVRLIESCKSLIGINRLSPNQKLIKFAEDYSKIFTLEEIEFDANELSTPPVVGFLDLELSLLDSCIEDSFKNAYYLTKVSDGSGFPGDGSGDADGQVIGSQFAEGTGAPEGWRDELSDTEFYAQIFKTSVPLMSGSAMATKYRGFPNEWKRIYAEHIMSHIELSRAHNTQISIPDSMTHL